jgi:hypothetical protein
MLLELAQEEVDMRTHAIVHLENAVEMQDLELDDREEQFASLVQQVHVAQIQVPPAPQEDQDEAELMSGVEDG